MKYRINDDYKLSATTVDIIYSYYKVINDIRILMLWLMFWGIDEYCLRHANLHELINACGQLLLSSKVLINERRRLFLKFGVVVNRRCL